MASSRSIAPQVTEADRPAVTAAAEAALKASLSDRLKDMATRAAEIICTEVPTYAEASDALFDDVRAHVIAHLSVIVERFGTARTITREELLFIRGHAARRVGRIPIADFVNAFYIGERVLWETALSLAHDDASRRAALAFATHLPRYFEVATTHAAEVYLEAEEQLAATGERIRRDLLEDLITGVSLTAGPRLDAARAAGLTPGVHCIVITATPVAPCEDQHMLRGAAAALARAAGTAVMPLTVLRHREIDVVVPIRGDGDGDGAAHSLEERITSSQQRLAAGGLALSIGISTEVSGTEQVANAYRESELARLARGGDAGVTALAGMSAFDYLTLGHDTTASRLIAPAVAHFVSDDADQGGVLIQTLRDYVACDLNARRTAERLHIHVNTCHYRLGRIAERTGSDLHRVTDLIEILIAARMHSTG
jgi:PucR C-terminal helix-turn-helix domain/GGDEF-like domain